MSKASETIYKELDKYLNTMTEIGKTPTNLYVSKKQFETLRAAEKADKEAFKPKYRGFDIVEYR